jgi:hypothetical protein
LMLEHRPSVACEGGARLKWGGHLPFPAKERQA